jgi:hypothetical protein
MDTIQECQLNHAAYRQLRDSINQRYPSGRYVAIAGGQIVADAEGFRELRAILVTLGKDPTRVLIVQAGVEYPETAIIFLQSMES